VHISCGGGVIRAPETMSSGRQIGCFGGGARYLAVRGISHLSTLEAVACRESLALVANLYLHRAHIATDGLEVINTSISVFSRIPFSVISDFTKIIGQRQLLKKERPVIVVCIPENTSMLSAA
jgi:hypothetical protein